MNFPVKILHRWTASPKPPSKLPVKDWCKEKKQRWFVAKFHAVPSQTQIKYFQKKDDWTTGAKAGTQICLSEVISSRVLGAKDDEYRMEINLENYSIMVIFDHRQAADNVCQALKTALRTFHVNLEKSPNPEVLGEYIACVESDNITFRCINVSDFSFQWEFSKIKGLQFKSDFGQLNMELSKSTATGGGQYIFTGQRTMQFAKKLKTFMSHEEDRYKPLPAKGQSNYNSLPRSRTLSVPNTNIISNTSLGLYDVPHEPRAGYTNGYQSGSDSGTFAPGPHYGHIPAHVPPQMMGQYPGNYPQMPHPQQSPYVSNMPYSPQGMMPPPNAMYANGSMFPGQVPMYVGHPPHPQAIYPMIPHTPKQNGFEEENIYEEIPHDIIISRETPIDQRPPMALPRSPGLSVPAPPLPLRGNSSERSPVSFSSASEGEDEQEKMRQVEEAISQIAIGKQEEAEDVGYVPVAPRTVKKEAPQPEDDGYFLMYPTKGGK
jgi:hypothetical protein